jgi:cytidylate kinase
MIIAIDGPAGAGKSTVAKLLAKKLGFLYIDTGAMYRALTLKALETAADMRQENTIVTLARTTRVDLLPNEDGSLRVLLDGKDVSIEIRHPRITEHVSHVAKIKEVREIMVQLQRALGAAHNSVLEGRDIGTVVFPQAEKKFFIDAHFKERVKRRYKDMEQLSVKDASLSSVAADLQNRDTIDSTREVAPLKKAQDAIYIDTTHLTIEEVVEKMLTFIRCIHQSNP